MITVLRVRAKMSGILIGEVSKFIKKEGNFFVRNNDK